MGKSYQHFILLTLRVSIELKKNQAATFSCTSALVTYECSSIHQKNPTPTLQTKSFLNSIFHPIIVEMCWLCNSPLLFIYSDLMNASKYLHCHFQDSFLRQTCFCSTLMCMASGHIQYVIDNQILLIPPDT